MAEVINLLTYFAGRLAVEVRAGVGGGHGGEGGGVAKVAQRRVAR